MKIIILRSYWLLLMLTCCILMLGCTSTRNALSTIRPSITDREIVQGIKEVRVYLATVGGSPADVARNLSLKFADTYTRMEFPERGIKLLETVGEAEHQSFLSILLIASPPPNQYQSKYDQYKIEYSVFVNGEPHLIFRDTGSAIDVLSGLDELFSSLDKLRLP